MTFVACFSFPVWLPRPSRSAYKNAQYSYLVNFPSCNITFCTTFQKTHHIETIKIGQFIQFIHSDRMTAFKQIKMLFVWIGEPCIGVDAPQNILRTSHTNQIHGWAVLEQIYINKCTSPRVAAMSAPLFTYSLV